VLLSALVLAAGVSACGEKAPARTGCRRLVIGGIQDQDVALLEERFGGRADCLSEEVRFPVRYQPAIDYTALVIAFASGD
jgi:ABC-type phosphate/phosphonate transport system substrate-binding protein